MDIYDAIIAIERNDLDAIIHYVNSGLGVEDQTDKGWTMLIVAVYNQRIKIVKWLIEKGANVNHVSNNGTTVFMYAKTKILQTKNYNLLNLLIREGADLNVRDYKNKWTVLQYVKELKHQEMINYLINNGAK